MSKTLSYFFGGLSALTASLAVMGARARIERGEFLSSLSPQADKIPYVSVALAVLGLVLWGWTAYLFVTSRADVKDRVMRQWRQRREYFLDTRVLVGGEIDREWSAIEALAKASMGADWETGILDQQKMKMHAAVNKHAVIALFKVSPSKKGSYGELTGLAVLSGLTPAAVTELEAAEVLSGHELSRPHLMSSYSKSAALYLAGVYGRDMSARAEILWYVRVEIQRLVSRHPSIRSVYARGATRDGLRLLRKHEFAPCPKNDVIWKKNRKEVS